MSIWTIAANGLYIANGIVMGWIVWYGIRTYVLPTIYHGLARQAQVRDQRQASYHAALTHYEHLKNQIHAQEKEGERLLLLVQRWHDHMTHVQKKYIQECQKINADAHRYHLQQQRTRIEHALTRATIPTAYSQAYKVLQEKYSTEQVGNQVLMTILNDLESTHE